jgi:hypothetical protein
MRNWCASTYHGAAAARRAAQLADGGDQRRPCRLGDGGRQHRLEQAVHAAVQGVVFERLPVGAVRGLRQVRAVLHEAGVAAATVAAAVLQVVVQGQRVPARDQGIERGQRHAGQRGHVLRLQQGVAVWRSAAAASASGV